LSFSVTGFSEIPVSQRGEVLEPDLNLDSSPFWLYGLSKPLHLVEPPLLFCKMEIK
jgi:hypothetical protein